MSWSAVWRIRAPMASRGLCGFMEFQVCRERLETGELLSLFTGCGKSVLARFLSQNATTKYAFTRYFRSSADKSSSMATPFVVALLARLFESDSLQPESHFGVSTSLQLPRTRRNSQTHTLLPR